MNTCLCDFAYRNLLIYFTVNDIKMTPVAAQLKYRSHSGGDSAALGIVSLSFTPTSWDLGPRRELGG